MTHRLRTAALAVLTGFFCFSLAGCSHGVQGTPESGKTMIFALDQAEEHPSYIALEDFADRLGEATGGRWDIQVQPNASLGDQQETVQLASDGAVDMVVASGTLLENLNPEFRTLALPLLYRDIDHQMAVLSDENLLGDLFTSLEDSNGLTVLGGFTQGERELYTRSGPIEGPDDLSGKRIRVQESDLMLEMLRAMGGSPTPLSYAEIYTAIQSGVLDGAENNLISYMTEGHHEVAEHVALTSHQIGTDYVVINTDVLEGMDGADREVFEREWQATVDHHTELWQEETDQARAEAEDLGTEFTEVDAKAFRDGLEEMVDEELDDTEARQLYEQIQEHDG